jgi:hypothetical protein
VVGLQWSAMSSTALMMMESSLPRPVRRSSWGIAEEWMRQLRALGSPRMHLHLLTLPLIAYRGRRETPAMLGNPTLQRRARGISREARQYASSETKSRTQQRAYSSRQETALPPMRQLDAAEIQCGRGRIVTTMRSDNGEVVEDSSCRMRFCSSAQRPRFSS